MLFDTHCHINLNAFRQDGPEVLQRALDAGVAVVNVGTQIDTSRQAVALLEQFPENVYAAVGLHPTHTFKHQYHDEEEVSFKTRDEKFDYEAYKQMASNERVVGIGECGLDYYRLPEDMDAAEIKQKQQQAFLDQVKLAVELDKALCIHCRPSQGTMDAYEDIIDIIKETQTNHPSLRFEIHCYTGDLATAQKFVQLGGYIGLNGIIVFDKTGRSEEIVKNISLESIILETDAPYLTPPPHRGTRNEPAHVKYVAEKIAEWKNETFDRVAEVTTANAKKLFNL
jgi:TatD DNase family protein